MKKTTQAALAKQLGVSRQTVAHYKKKGDAPPLDDLDAWQDHLAINGRDSGAPPEIKAEIAKERLRILRAQAEKKERDNRKEAGVLVEADYMKRRIGELVGQLFFGELDRLAHEFPVLLKGKDEIAIHEECLKQIEEVKKALRNWLQSSTASTSQIRDSNMTEPSTDFDYDAVEDGSPTGINASCNSPSTHGQCCVDTLREFILALDDLKLNRDKTGRIIHAFAHALRSPGGKHAMVHLSTRLGLGKTATYELMSKLKSGHSTISFTSIFKK